MLTGKHKIVNTRISRVRDISSMDLIPAETTPTGVLANSTKSALISKANKMGQFNNYLITRSTYVSFSMYSTYPTSNEQGYTHFMCN